MADLPLTRLRKRPCSASAYGLSRRPCRSAFRRRWEVIEATGGPRRCGETRRARFVRSRSSATSETAIAAYAVWNPEQEAELRRLEAEVTAGNASTPSARMVGAERQEQGATNATRAFRSCERVSQDSVAELKRAVAADVVADAALNAAQALGDEDVSAERLKGKGLSRELVVSHVEQRRERCRLPHKS